MPIWHTILNVELLVAAFNEEKALVGAFSMIVKTDGSFAALDVTQDDRAWHLPSSPLLLCHTNWRSSDTSSCYSIIGPVRRPHQMSKASKAILFKSKDTSGITRQTNSHLSWTLSDINGVSESARKRGLDLGLAEFFMCPLFQEKIVTCIYNKWSNRHLDF